MIELTVPYDPGSKDPGKTYTHVKIISDRRDNLNAFVRLEWQYGEFIEGAFIVGKEPARSVNVTDEELVTMQARLSQTDEPCLAAADRAYDQHLLDQSIVAGTIVGS